jgi:hypothetical protein
VTTADIPARGVSFFVMAIRVLIPGAQVLEKWNGGKQAIEE